ncbi:MAG: DUF4962 domain-containing protein [Planctomycetales bacterium]|nr:DUF4962 domain-containing protein [Planctomycetales bacterium]
MIGSPFLRWTLLLSFALWTLSPTWSAEELDERPAVSGEWGYRPAQDAVSEVNPPSFSWRPQSNVLSWEVQCARGTDWERTEYQAAGIAWNVHCPPRTFPPGEYRWRYRGWTQDGQPTAWSQTRQFRISPQAVEMPLPPRAELLARIPKTHPRLFVRPEDLPRLRELAQGAMREQFERLQQQCDALLADPPPTEEPPKYGPQIVKNSDEWREIWWGNRTYTTRTLDGAATLAFTWLLGGNDEYGQLAKRLLLECAQWDPHGSTGYLYNDEAGMPYNYYFVRTYTFVHDLLTEEEREICRRVMKIRGDEMYQHLYPRHLWRPYSSHSNRAWHFLGEIGVALQDEVEGADDWVWFAMNVFQNVYPVWSDDDGGWHEGFVYWNSYLGRFTWWADTMRSAMRVNAYDGPYFSRVGYYPLYLLPPGKLGAGFGDLNAHRKAADAVPLVSQLATQAGNGHWQWYVEQLGGAQAATGYVGFVRGAMPPVTPRAPDDLPTSRLFRGIGQAVLNTTLESAADDVQIVFKSSPFGTQSHGYEANNSFLLWAYGQRLLIRTGFRDSYGTEHHRQWMWSTRSVNNITVNGQGQLPHSAAAQGEVVAFHTSPTLDMVAGEAGDCYRTADGQPLLDRFTRSILFVKPELIIVYDRLQAPTASTFDYWLHATQPFAVNDQTDIQLQVDQVGCAISLLAPQKLEFSQTDQYDPNPRPRIKLREWHLTASTPDKSQTVEFVTLYRPHRAGATVPAVQKLTRIEGGYLLEADLTEGRITALLPNDDAVTLSAAGLSTQGKILLQRRGPDEAVRETVQLHGIMPAAH